MNFEQCFGAEAAASASAPGRVNLLGEHTDYNDGWVLPSAIPLRTRVAMRVNAASEFRVHSANLRRTASFRLDAPARDPFAWYVQGCLIEVAKLGVTVPALDIHVASDIPMGAGLSSSAALEVAVLRAVCSLLDLALDDVEIAALAQQAEIQHAGVHCGILDQMACSLLSPGAMLLLDTRSLERQILPIPERAELLVLDSGVPRSLAASPYNERRAECAQAARLLEVASLRDAAPGEAVDALPPKLFRRVRHVMTENARVAAARAATAQALGLLMNASHASLRDDFEVSIPALDCLTEAMRNHPAVYGAKLSGAGFGGACVALCRSGQAPACAAQILSSYAQAGYEGRQLLPVP